MIDIVGRITSNILTALYQSFGFSIVLAFVFMYMYLFAYEPCNSGKGIKAALKQWMISFRSSVKFRRLFALVFYSSMILFRTLFNRFMWMNPVSDVMGGWWIYDVDRTTGEVTLTTECIENFMLFIPFSILLLWALIEYINLPMTSLKKCVLFSGRTVFIFSLSIEFAQVFFRLGTFQFSDLFYNTLGGILGGLIFWIGSKGGKRNENRNFDNA